MLVRTVRKLHRAETVDSGDVGIAAASRNGCGRVSDSAGRELSGTNSSLSAALAIDRDKSVGRSHARLSSETEKSNGV